jgi:hypothetical protein
MRMHLRCIQVMPLQQFLVEAGRRLGGGSLIARDVQVYWYGDQQTPGQWYHCTITGYNNNTGEHEVIMVAGLGGVRRLLLGCWAAGLALPGCVPAEAVCLSLWRSSWPSSNAVALVSCTVLCM